MRKKRIKNIVCLASLVSISNMVQIQVVSSYIGPLCECRVKHNSAVLRLVSRQEPVPLRLYPRPHVPPSPLHVPGVAALGKLEVSVHCWGPSDLLRGNQIRAVSLVL